MLSTKFYAEAVTAKLRENEVYLNILRDEAIRNSRRCFRRPTLAALPVAFNRFSQLIGSDAAPLTPDAIQPFTLRSEAEQRLCQRLKPVWVMLNSQKPLLIECAYLNGLTHFGAK